MHECLAYVCTHACWTIAVPPPQIASLLRPTRQYNPVFKISFLSCIICPLPSTPFSFPSPPISQLWLTLRRLRIRTNAKAHSLGHSLWPLTPPEYQTRVMEWRQRRAWTVKVRQNPRLGRRRGLQPRMGKRRVLRKASPSAVSRNHHPSCIWTCTTLTPRLQRAVAMF